MSLMDDYSLTPRERAMLTALPRYRVGSAALEDRVVDALVRHGLLRRVGAAFGRAPWRVLSYLSAAAAVFVLGAAVDRTVNAADSAPASVGAAGGAVAIAMLAAASGAETRKSDSIWQRGVSRMAPLVRGAGNAAVSAVTQLPGDTVDALARIAGNFARATYRAASLQLARTHADSVVAMARSSRGFLLAEPVAR